MKTRYSFEDFFDAIFEEDNRLTREGLTLAIAEWSHIRGCPPDEYFDVSDDIMFSVYIWQAVEDVRKQLSLPSAKDEAKIYLHRAIAEVEFLPLPCVRFLERRSLPEESGVYLLQSEFEVLYVGNSENIRKRACDRNHSALNQITSEAQKRCWISWYICEGHWTRHRVEDYLIKRYEPILNSAGVLNTRKKKSRMSDREIRAMYFQSNPKTTYSAVARDVGVSPALVRQICLNANC